MKIQYGYTHCPKCGTDLDGGMIPVERRGLLQAERYSRLQYRYGSTDHDLEYFECPDCHKYILA